MYAYILHTHSLSLNQSIYIYVHIVHMPTWQQLHVNQDATLPKQGREARRTGRPNDLGSGTPSSPNLGRDKDELAQQVGGLEAPPEQGVQISL